MSRPGTLYAAVDIGAGSGAKIGLADADLNIIADGMVPRAQYGESADVLADALAKGIRGMLDRTDADAEDLFDKKLRDAPPADGKPSDDADKWR